MTNPRTSDRSGAALHRFADLGLDAWRNTVIVANLWSESDRDSFVDHLMDVSPDWVVGGRKISDACWEVEATIPADLRLDQPILTVVAQAFANTERGGTSRMLNEWVFQPADDPDGDGAEVAADAETAGVE